METPRFTHVTIVFSILRYILTMVSTQRPYWSLLQRRFLHLDWWLSHFMVKARNKLVSTQRPYWLLLQHRFCCDYLIWDHSISTDLTADIFTKSHPLGCSNAWTWFQTQSPIAHLEFWGNFWTMLFLGSSFVGPIVLVVLIYVYASLHVSWKLVWKGRVFQ